MFQPVRHYAELAQWIEHRSPKAGVVGSNPILGTRDASNPPTLQAHPSAPAGIFPLLAPPGIGVHHSPTVYPLSAPSSVG